VLEVVKLQAAGSSVAIQIRKISVKT
jgi:hypothetical protein